MHKKKTSARLDLTKHKDGRDNVDIWRLIRNPLVNLIISIKFVTPKVKRQGTNRQIFLTDEKSKGYVITWVPDLQNPTTTRI